MKLVKGDWEAMEHVGTRVFIDPDWPCQASMMSGFGVPPLEEKDGMQLVDVQVSFHGFNSLECHPDLMKAMGEICKKDFKWAVSGPGMVSFREGVWDNWQGEKKFDIGNEQVQRLTMFLGSVFKSVWSCAAEKVLFVFPGSEVENGELHFLAVSECSQETWQKLYHIRSLELTAALKHFEQLGGQMLVEPEGFHMVSGSRVLN